MGREAEVFGGFKKIGQFCGMETSRDRERTILPTAPFLVRCNKEGDSCMNSDLEVCCGIEQNRTEIC